jgi:hypothetical protein
MAYKTKSSPLNQFGSFGRLGSNVGQQSQNMFAGGLSGTMRNTAAQIAAQKAQQNTGMGINPIPVPTVKNQQTITPVKPTTINPKAMMPTSINPKAMMPTPINPKAVSNPKTVNGVYGNANANTFTRTVPGNEAPIMQLANPNILQDGPQLPPEAVQTSVTPTLGFENS